MSKLAKVIVLSAFVLTFIVVFTSGGGLIAQVDVRGATALQEGEPLELQDIEGDLLAIQSEANALLEDLTYSRQEFSQEEFIAIEEELAFLEYEASRLFFQAFDFRRAVYDFFPFPFEVEVIMLRIKTIFEFILRIFIEIERVLVVVVVK